MSESITNEEVIDVLAAELDVDRNVFTDVETNVHEFGAVRQQFLDSLDETEKYNAAADALERKYGLSRNMLSTNNIRYRSVEGIVQLLQSKRSAES